jgi:hypothetical protein
MLIGCAVTLPYIIEDDAQQASRRWPDATVQSLNEGRSLYIDHCSGCHSLHPPNEYTESEWKKSLDEMALKAKLLDTEKQLVYQYLITAGRKKLPSHSQFP